MIEYLTIAAVAMTASCLTFFSGFGLGTLLLPAFALFMPIELAIASTAIVHLLNNVFKFILIGKHTDIKTVLLFGLPALLFAVLGSWTLVHLSVGRPLTTYNLHGNVYEITLVNGVIAAMMVFFAILEVLPALANKHFPLKALPLGGAISGFFGGLSGHQGAIRSLFLLKSNLSKQAFIATSVVISCLVDITRIAIYSVGFQQQWMTVNINLFLAAIFSAFMGALIGYSLIDKITLRFIQKLVSLMVIVIAILLGLGLL